VVITLRLCVAVLVDLGVAAHARYPLLRRLVEILIRLAA
jgi:hypothetical protein